MRRKTSAGDGFLQQIYFHYALIILVCQTGGMLPGIAGKSFSERKVNLKKQRLLRKEVNNIQQRTLANDPITLIGNKTTPSVCGVMSR